MLKNEDGKVVGLIFSLLFKLILAIVLVILVAYATFRFMGYENEDIKSYIANGEIAGESYEVEVIDDEYPNIADYQEDSYFYDQLNDTAKALYLGIQDHLEDMKSGEYKIDFGTRFNTLLHEESGQAELTACYQVAVDALKLDNPDLFYIDFSKVYLNTYSVTQGTTTTYTVYMDKGSNDNYFADGFESKADVDLAVSNLEATKETILSGISLDSSNFEKILYVHDWLIDNVEYDESMTNANRSNSYGALVERCVTCQGYAKAFKYLLDALSVPCVVIRGDATNSAGSTEKHAWNYIMINDCWYAIDVTWDDPIVIGDGEVSNEVRYKYFCKGNSFLANHTEDASIEGTTYYFEFPSLISDT